MKSSTSFTKDHSSPSRWAKGTQAKGNYRSSHLPPHPHFLKFLLYSIAKTAVKVSSLLLHHLPDCPFQLLAAVQRGVTMHTPSRLLIYQVTM